MDLEKHRPIAALYRVERDHRVETVVTGLIVSNGLAWSPDGTVLYHSDSRQNTIWRYAFAPATGQATERRVFATVDPEREGRPDGAAVDAEGCYWSAGVGAGRLTRYAPDGCVDRIIQLPVRFPSMCAFGGPELDVLYLTSAREFLSPAELEEEPLAGGLFALRPGVKGLAVPRYGG
jgi:sugar lactone lactonase YvrE